MIKINKERKKKSAKKALYCFVATAVVFANGPSARAFDNTDVSANINQNQIILGGNDEVLIDKDIKFYNDINKIRRLAGFDFKLVDYVIKGSQIGSYQIHKISDTSNAVEIFFENESDEEYITYSVVAFDGDPIENIKKIDKNHNSINNNYKVDVNSEKLSIGETKGECITFTITMPARTTDGGVFEDTENIKKYFVWKDDGIYYAIDYDDSYKRKDCVSNIINIPENELEKMVTSLKPLNEVKYIDYLTDLSEKRGLSTECRIMEIYDREDLKQAQSFLGFNPKMLLKTNNDIEISNSCIGITSDSDIENNNIHYELDSFYVDKNKSITFNQSNHDSFNYYKDIKNNGYVVKEDWVTGEKEKVNVEKVIINGIEVFKYKESSVNNFIGESNTTSFYVWKEDDVYCGLILFGTEENTDEIVEEFVKSTPIE